jgi:hypothetical protein
MAHSFDNHFVSVQVQEFYDPPLTDTVISPESQTRYIPLRPEPVLKLHITGFVKTPADYSKIVIMAPAPIQRFLNYSGSALPFPCAKVAFDNTPNYVDLTRPVDGATTSPTDVDVVFEYPNAYYTADHTERISPSIFFALTPVRSNETLYVRLELPNPHPLKTLTYRPGFAKGPEFYQKKEELVGVPENQEAYLRAIGPLKAKYDLA